MTKRMRNTRDKTMVLLPGVNLMFSHGVFVRGRVAAVWYMPSHDISVNTIIRSDDSDAGGERIRSFGLFARMGRRKRENVSRSKLRGARAWDGRGQLTSKSGALSPWTGSGRSFPSKDMIGSAKRNKATSYIPVVGDMY